MGFLHVIIPAVAAVLLWGSGASKILFWLAILTSAGSFWSFGVMHNYATESAKHRDEYSGGFNEFNRADLNAVPGWLATVNLLFALVGVGILLVALYVRFV